MSEINQTFVKVYLERRKSRVYVGKLYKKIEGKKSHFIFEYDQTYLLSHSAIPVGPEFPLNGATFSSPILFSSFSDRIPSKHNPAYDEYIAEFQIDRDEKDPFILLTTIGRKGPSSFVFELEKEGSNKNHRQEILQFRKSLGLTIREFATVFDISPTTVQKIEHGVESGKEVVKRLEIYIQYPEVALNEFKKNGHELHGEKFKETLKRLEWRSKQTS